MPKMDEQVTNLATEMPRRKTEGKYCKCFGCQRVLTDEHTDGQTVKVFYRGRCDRNLR